MGRRILFILIILGLSLSTLFLWRDFKTTASGSLYYLGKAIYTHDAGLFFKYFDYEEVIGKFRPLPADTSFLSRLAYNAYSGLDENGSAYIRGILEDSRRPNLPGSLALLLSARQGDEENGRVEVMLNLLEEKSLRFTLARYPDNTWKVVEINQNDLQWLFLGYMGVN